MKNGLAVVGGKEHVNLPVFRAVRHEQVARIHKEELGEPPTKGLRLAVKVLLLRFLDTREHELEQVALVLGRHVAVLFVGPTSCPRNADSTPSILRGDSLLSEEKGRLAGLEVG